jgi:peptide deformylase
MTQLVEANDPILHSVLEPFDFANAPADPEDIAKDLVQFMRDSNGIGLAANQVGLPYRVFVIEGEPAYACFNPRVVMPSEEMVTLEEGCLTFPGYYIKVKRPKSIRVRFQGPDGETYTKTFTGMTARVFQHELDHLDGIAFQSRASRVHRDQANSRWKQWKRKNK